MSQRKESSLMAEQRFVSALNLYGYSSLEPNWLGTNKPHRIKCGTGHIYSVRPGDLWRGRHPCGKCTSLRVKTIFYVVATHDLRVIKFGVTSRKSQVRRLSDHRADGFTMPLRIFKIDKAYELEQNLIDLLSLQTKPIIGKEYYDGSVTQTILEYADNFKGELGK